MKTKKNVIKGYKGFDKDFKCRGFQFKVGKTYKHKGELKMCSSGFHFCKKAADVLGYYSGEDIRYAEVTSSSCLDEGNKSVTDKITIVREISKEEWLTLVNSGHHNSGNCNSGHHNSGHHNSGNCNSGSRNSGYYNSGYYNSGSRNSGNCNSGSRNSGHYNSGHCNSGDYNSGYYNSGSRNSGNCNSGSRNSGNCNSGSYNSGYYNSGNYNSGFFNSNTPTVRLFNKDSKLTFDDKRVQVLFNLQVKPILQWTPESLMTDKEKTEFPSYKTTGGFLKNTGRNDYSSLTDENIALIKSLPHFNDKIFKEITGISLLALEKQKKGKKS